MEDSPIKFPKIKEFKCCYKLFANNKSNSFQCCKVVISVSFKLCTVCLDLKQLFQHCYTVDTVEMLAEETILIDKMVRRKKLVNFTMM